MIHVIGVGERWRRDDSVGLIVADHLRSLGLTDADVRTVSGEGTALLECWSADDDVIIIDAVASGAEPGVVHRWAAHERPIPAWCFRHTTHAFGVAEGIELARTLRRLPRRLIVYGIEGADWGMGEGLSTTVNQAVPTVVDRVRRDVRRWRETASVEVERHA